jgi:mono/diheme cytochrome c family protein
LNGYSAHAQKDSIRYIKGKAYFRTLCSSCHSANQEIYGPMLGSITKKKRESWLIPFIQNSQAVINSGDPYAKALYERFDKQVMPSFSQLSREDIQDILHYLEIESTEPGEYLNDLDILFTKDSRIVKGKQDFLEHCATCHFIHKESTFAPALGSVTKRHSREWLVSFIQNSQKKIQGGDPYALHLFNQFNQNVMTTMDFLPVEEIHSILDYIEYASTLNVAYTGKINKAEYKKEAVAQIKKATSSYSGISFISFALLMVMLFCMVSLLFIAYIFVIKTNRTH